MQEGLSNILAKLDFPWIKNISTSFKVQNSSEILVIYFMKEIRNLKNIESERNLNTFFLLQKRQKRIKSNHAFSRRNVSQEW